MKMIAMHVTEEQHKVFKEYVKRVNKGNVKKISMSDIIGYALVEYMCNHPDGEGVKYEKWPSSSDNDMRMA